MGSTTRMRQLFLLLATSIVLVAAHDTASDVKALGKMHTFFLLDRSGSMSSIRDDVVGGFNQYLQEQQDAQDGNGMVLTLAQFDSGNPFQLVYDAVPINGIPPMNLSSFKPRGGTPLYDAIGAMIHHADGHNETAERVVIVVFSDGAENSSFEYDRSRVFDLISQRQKEHQWAFVFLGANQDSYAAGRDMGIAGGNTQNFAFDADGVKTAMRSLSRASVAQREAMAHTLDAEGGGATYDSSDFFLGVKESEADYQARKFEES